MIYRRGTWKQQWTTRPNLLSKCHGVHVELYYIWLFYCYIFSESGQCVVKQCSPLDHSNPTSQPWRMLRMSCKINSQGHQQQWAKAPSLCWIFLGHNNEDPHSVDKRKPTKCVWHHTEGRVQFEVQRSWHVKNDEARLGQKNFKIKFTGENWIPQTPYTECRQQKNWARKDSQQFGDRRAGFG